MKEYEPLGATKTEKANVRIISATNRDLWSLVQSGQFREDLYFRLNVMRIGLPPLRERREDISLLIDHFVREFNAREGKDITGLTHSAMEILLNYDYPGNVRELKNIIEHAVILCQGDQISPDFLPAHFRGKKSVTAARNLDLQTMEEFEKEQILKTLKKHKGKIEKAAEEMGIHRTTLWRKMKKKGITQM
jgi:transcriptional regulator with PAS, ATPase and Fis domain